MEPKRQCPGKNGLIPPSVKYPTVVVNIHQSIITTWMSVPEGDRVDARSVVQVEEMAEVSKVVAPLVTVPSPVTVDPLVTVDLLVTAAPLVMVTNAEHPSSNHRAHSSPFVGQYIRLLSNMLMKQIMTCLLILLVRTRATNPPTMMPLVVMMKRYSWQTLQLHSISC